MANVILYPSNMPCEVGMTAFVSAVSNTVLPIGFTTKEAEDAVLVLDRINERLRLGERSMISNVGTPENCPKVHPPDGIILGLLFGQFGVSGGILKFYINHFAPVLQMIQDRLFKKDILENQIFYTGLYNVGPKGLDNFTRFTNLFDGITSLDDIMEKGKTILESQIGLAAERVLNNSRKVKLADNTEAVITEGPDLVNLTHEQLHQKYPDIPVTVLISFKFSKDDKPKSETNCDEIGYSLRSFDKTVNVHNIVKNPSDAHFKGYGYPDSAGGRIAFNLELPF